MSKILVKTPLKKWEIDYENIVELRKEIITIYHETAEEGFIGPEITYNSKIIYENYLYLDIIDIINDREFISFIVEGCLIVLYIILVDDIYDGPYPFLDERAENCQLLVSKFNPQTEQQKKVQEHILIYLDLRKNKKQNLYFEKYAQFSDWVFKEFIHNYYKTKYEDTSASISALGKK